MCCSCPHHGSRTSSSEEFIDAVAPRWAVVPAGYRNRFGHPAREVLARYDGRGGAACCAPIWTARSASCSEPRLTQVRARARLRPRYWRLHRHPDARIEWSRGALPRPRGEGDHGEERQRHRLSRHRSHRHQQRTPGRTRRATRCNTAAGTLARPAHRRDREARRAASRTARSCSSARASRCPSSTTADRACSPRSCASPAPGASRISASACAG